MPNRVPPAVSTSPCRVVHSHPDASSPTAPAADVESGAGYQLTPTRADKLVDAIVARPVRFGEKRAPFSIPTEVAVALSDTNSANREYNLGRLIWAHTWNAAASAFGAVPQWKQANIIRDFEARRDEFMAIARAAYAEAQPRIVRHKEKAREAALNHKAMAEHSARTQRAAAKQAAREYAALARSAAL